MDTKISIQLIESCFTTAEELGLAIVRLHFIFQRGYTAVAIVEDAALMAIAV